MRDDAPGFRCAHPGYTIAIRKMRKWGVQHNTASCPRLSRASTSFYLKSKADVDGRDKPGHDEGSRCGTVAPDFAALIRPACDCAPKKMAGCTPGHQKGRDLPRSVPERTLVTPAIAGRLISNAAVIGAVGQFIRGFAAAKEELGTPGIANRPSAGLLRQLQQSFALLDW